MHNPYAPPTAPTVDVPPAVAAGPVPALVVRACQLMWLSFALSFASACIGWWHSPVSGAQRWAMLTGALIGTCFSLALTAWFTMKLRARRNWMRILLNVLNAVSLLFIPFIWKRFGISPKALFANGIQGALTLAQWIANYASVVLVNLRPARAWFTARLEE